MLYDVPGSRSVTFTLVPSCFAWNSVIPFSAFFPLSTEYSIRYHAAYEFPVQLTEAEVAETIGAAADDDKLGTGILVLKVTDFPMVSNPPPFPQYTFTV